MKAITTWSSSISTSKKCLQKAAQLVCFRAALFRFRKVQLWWPIPVPRRTSERMTANNSVSGSTSYWPSDLTQKIFRLTKNFPVATVAEAESNTKYPSIPDTVRQRSSRRLLPVSLTFLSLNENYKQKKTSKAARPCNSAFPCGEQQAVTHDPHLEV